MFAAPLTLNSLAQHQRSPLAARPDVRLDTGESSRARGPRMLRIYQGSAAAMPCRKLWSHGWSAETVLCVYLLLFYRLTASHLDCTCQYVGVDHIVPKIFFYRKVFFGSRCASPAHACMSRAAHLHGLHAPDVTLAP